jgi:hypothetical protein
MDNQSPNAAVLAAAMAQPAKANTDRLAALRAKVAEARDQEAQKADLEERLTAINISLQDLYYKALPDLLDEVGVPKITLAAEGNMPEVTAEAKPFYRANIASGWPDEQRKAAFAYLDELNSGDIIKTQVGVQFGRDQRDDAIAFADQLAKGGMTPILKEEVPHSTLTAWLKEQVEKHNFTPDLDKIGGTVGRVVKLKSKD